MVLSRRMWILASTALLICFVIAGSAIAAPYDVHFKSGMVQPSSGTYQLPTEVISAADLDRVHVLIQMQDYVHAGVREALKSHGIELLSYFPDRAYAASVPRDLDLSTLSGLGIRNVTPMLVEYKLHPRVMNEDFGAWSAFQDAERIFAVDIMPDVSLDDAEALLKDMGFEVGHHFNAAHTLLVAMSPEKVYEAATADFVLFIDEMPPPMDMVNNIVRQRIHVDEVQAAPYNLNGDSVTIMVYDGGGVDSTHPDFGDRVTWNENMTVADHSTHVAGTVGGSGANSGGQYRGMAPSARIISGQYDACVPYCLYESPNDFEPDYTRARDVFGIEVTTNSIGANIDLNGYPCEWMGDYESTSRLLDHLVSSTSGDPLIMCFAAGNERNGTTCGLAQYRCMSVPAGAKNIITVGATTATDGVASFSSWGPTDDGRTKPEVCSDGVNVTSTLPGGGYGAMSGTSMATPGVGGVTCLLLQQWHRQFPGAPDPLPETMKAILINSTTDVGPAGVDFQTGFGLVNALKAVNNMLAGGVLESSLEVDEEFTHTFDVPDTMTVLDVSLAWSDIPAAGNVIPTLVNDLDLWLTDPSNTIYRPWRLNPNNPGAPALTGIDTINVCERVHVTSPVAGTWTLHVAGTLNGSESQTFGLSSNATLVEDWASIIGQIRNGSQNGIAGRVQVVGGAQGMNTDTTGNYLLYVPGNDTYPVRAMSFGYVPQTINVVVSTGQITQNFTLNTAQNGTLTGTVQNQFGAPLAGAIVSFEFPNAVIPDDTTDVNGEYSVSLPGANSYGVTADYFGQEGSGVATVPEGGSVTLDITISDPRFGPVGPDNYGYYCYESTDPGYGESYNWMEISPAVGGPGTAITPGTGNDWVSDVTLPFPFRFYGQENTQIRIGADGWIGAGLVPYGSRQYVNQPIPTDSLPNGIIALFWDDLRPAPAPGEGDLSYYDDAANGRFIVEYHNVSHYSPTTNHVTAQLIIYNLQTRPTLTNDNEFVMQYQQVDYSDSNDTDADATIGCENYAGDDGLEVVYAGTFDESVWGLGAQTVYRFTTGAVTGYGSVDGQITMIPPPDDWSLVDIVFGPYTIHPENGGAYSLDSVIANVYAMTVNYAGYETGTATVTVTDGGTTSTDFELYRLDPARELTGSYDSEAQVIHLNWRPPAWSEETPPEAQRWDVSVANFSFTPADITVAPGDTVVWTNNDGFHNVHHTGNPSLFGNTPASSPWTYSYVFNLPDDTYPYICEVHPAQMTGSVTVQTSAPAENGRGTSPLDAFTGYQVWRSGVGVVATVQDTFYDFDVTQSGNYIFWILAAYDGGQADTSNHYRVIVSLAAGENQNDLPSSFYLAQNYPNPFNPTTTIEYGLPHASSVTIEVFDLLGREVAVLENGFVEPGIHRITFDASHLGSGVYYYRIKTPEFQQIRKLLFLR